MNWTWTHVLLLVGMTAAAGLAQEGRTPSPAQGGKRESGDSAPAALSDGERIARLKRAIEDAETRLAELRGKLNDPDGEFAQSEAEFKKVDVELETRKKELDRARVEERAADIQRISDELPAIEQRRRLSKERFDLAVLERKTLQEQIASLESKLLPDREALNSLLNAPVKPMPAAPGEASNPAPTAGGEAPSVAASPDAAHTGASAPAPSATQPGVAVPSAPATSTTTARLPKPESPARPPSKEVVEAQKQAQTKQTEAAQAEQQAQSVTDRIEATSKTLGLERKLLDTARKKSQNAQQTQQTLSQQARQRWREAAPQEELTELWDKVGEAEKRVQEAAEEVAIRRQRVDELVAELQQLQADQIVALKDADRKQREADEARRKVERLESPLSLQNILRWVTERGPRVFGFIVGMALLQVLVHVADKRLIHLLAGRSTAEDPEDRENRAKTLVAVFHSTATVAIYVGGTLMILTELSVNIVPLMGGAAVIGLAVAFGAQNLIRDYFCGFMILLENQYGINDVVKIGELSGQVERISLRLTVLRGLDGTVHFVPNGEISRVSNMTHGWSRALLDIGVAYKEDVDRVMQELIEIARELRRDPEFRGIILEMPEMLGVDELGDSAVIIKFFIKTRPLKQWAVRREMLRRIKKRFDKLGIEIPFPHRTVYHRHDESPGARERDDEFNERASAGRPRERLEQLAQPSGR